VTANSSRLYLAKPASCGPIMPTIDAKLVDGSGQEVPPGPDSAAKRLSELESFRAGSMGYWLAAASPRPSPQEAAAAAKLLDDERGLLAELKGAYFLILVKILPMHYSRTAGVIDSGDPDSYKYPDTSKGLDHYKRILGELDKLYQRMQPIAPKYAAKRLDAVAGANALSETLGRHRSGSPAVPAS